MTAGKVIKPNFRTAIPKMADPEDHLADLPEEDTKENDHRKMPSQGNGPTMGKSEK